MLAAASAAGAGADGKEAMVIQAVHNSQLLHWSYSSPSSLPVDQ